MNNQFNQNLRNKWILWKKDTYHNQRNEFNYMIGQKKILKIKSVQDLCRYSNTKYWSILDFFFSRHIANCNISSCELSLFKEKINPTWEHKKNCYGSSFQFYVEMSEAKIIQQVWENLVCEFISDDFQFSQNINGLKAIDRTTKTGAVKFEIWIDLGSERHQRSQQNLKHDKIVLRVVVKTIEKILQNLIKNQQRPKLNFKEHLDKVYQILINFFKFQKISYLIQKNINTKIDA